MGTQEVTSRARCSTETRPVGYGAIEAVPRGDVVRRLPPYALCLLHALSAAREPNALIRDCIINGPAVFLVRMPRVL